MIKLNGISKTFTSKSGSVTAARDVFIRVEDGAIYGIIGYSGAGKSTLVRCLNLLETPDTGSMKIGEREIFFAQGKAYLEQNGKRVPMKEKEKSALRRSIGMIFQHFNLLDRSTVFENVAYPLKFTGRKKAEIEKRVMELLELVGLTDKADAYPSQLSGGQKQRVAIARALANDPEILLSDEATSALDPDATESILNLLKDLNKKLGITILLITHEMAVIKAICQRVAVMENGAVVEEGSVYDIFAKPQAEITRRFIASSTPLGRLDKLMEECPDLFRLREGEMLARLTFEKNCVGEHIITNAARLYAFDLNVLLSNVELLEGAPLGGVIGILSGKKEDIENGVKWLEENHVTTEVLKRGN